MRQCINLWLPVTSRGRCLPRPLLGTPRALGPSWCWALVWATQVRIDQVPGIVATAIDAKVPTTFTLEFPLQNGVVKICYKLEFLWCNWKGGFGIDVSKVRGPLFSPRRPNSEKTWTGDFVGLTIDYWFYQSTKMGSTYFWGTYMFFFLHMILCN